MRNFLRFLKRKSRIDNHIYNSNSLFTINAIHTVLVKDLALFSGHACNHFGRHWLGHQSSSPVGFSL
ncbi:hypothetical protein MESS4_80045 [Mesorhizobium sp. STM 4661]|nr:hypothetical protein MESS4_80045 [Mesorhizobium sp. STM 4661]